MSSSSVFSSPETKLSTKHIDTQKLNLVQDSNIFSLNHTDQLFDTLFLEGDKFNENFKAFIFNKNKNICYGFQIKKIKSNLELLLITELFNQDIKFQH